MGSLLSLVKGFCIQEIHFSGDIFTPSQGLGEIARLISCCVYAWQVKRDGFLPPLTLVEDEMMAQTRQKVKHLAILSLDVTLITHS